MSAHEQQTQENTGDESDLVSKLTNKISQQAQELSSIYNQLERSKLVSGESKSHRVTGSDATAQKRVEKHLNQQIDALQKQLALTESRLSDSTKARTKLSSDLETKSRECKLLEKKVNEQSVDIEKLRAQLAAALRVQDGPGALTQRVFKHSNSRNATGRGRVAPPPPPSHDVGDQTDYKALLGEVQKELELVRERESDLLVNIKVLEEAFDFRSEEIGMKGHSDLLIRLAKLRSEVTTLKQSLQDEHSRAVEAEEYKSDAESQHADLQQQIVLVQSRLAQAQQESHMLQTVDMRSVLRDTQAERDKLLAFIQGDMQKAGILAKQVEKLEVELRLSRRRESDLNSERSELSATIAQNDERIKVLKDELSSERARWKDLSQSDEQLKYESEQLYKQLERSKTERSDLNKNNMELLENLKEREKELEQEHQQHSVTKALLYDMELAMPILQKDNATLNQRLEFIEQELFVCRQTLSTVEPKLARAEPEVDRLRSEAEELRLTNANISKELAEVKHIKSLLSDLTNEITSVNSVSGADGKVFRETDFGGGQLADTVNSKTTVSSSLNSGTGRNSHLSYSQKHSLWIGVPSIRNVNVALYENIRSMAHDLKKAEAQCLEVARELERSRSDSEVINRNHELKIAALTQQIESAHTVIDTLNDNLEKAQGELNRARSAVLAAEQIKVVLTSFPGKLLELMSSVLQHHSAPYRDTTERTSSNSVYSAFGANSTRSINFVTDTPSKLVETNPSSATAANQDAHKESNDEHILDNFPINLLPDLIGKAIMFNSSAVRSLYDVSKKYNEVYKEYDALVSKHKKLVCENEDATERLEKALHRLEDRDAQMQCLTEEYKKEMETAADLAEKQNSLTTDLEAQLDNLHRDRQLKAAQLVAYQQKQEEVRCRLLGPLKSFCMRSGRLTVPPDGTNLQELLNLNADVLCSFSRDGTSSDETSGGALTRPFRATTTSDLISHHHFQRNGGGNHHLNASSSSPHYQSWNEGEESHQGQSNKHYVTDISLNQRHHKLQLNEEEDYYYHQNANGRHSHRDVGMSGSATGWAATPRYQSTVHGSGGNGANGHSRPVNNTSSDGSNNNAAATHIQHRLQRAQNAFSAMKENR